ncbi:hypothetical protein [Pseudobacteriovorax antillogorgiicola]|uniref:Uncharacterized protein n=1 Tax=Pseudobacteriovorax antillogorgiicola TaxID=1513793 RepID=A0A1Y6C9A8_9BACT|nr:hypothetical protein [Pseudobacteriovorax antillogorgiicola]TCS51649.1 hypothetical protein EDD56_11033 [Pseudobacteriovorax antillogorgiicola]SMF48806.1 hypothetical protein SAMN06296036_1152 [Pseudobacteriovorax antillogorgiicola]
MLGLDQGVDLRIPDLKPRQSQGPVINQTINVNEAERPEVAARKIKEETLNLFKNSGNYPLFDPVGV